MNEKYNLEKLKDKLKKLFNLNTLDSYVIYEFFDSLIIINRYDEQLEFFKNGKVKCTRIPQHCKFIVDLLRDIKLSPTHTISILSQWDENEKSGYWYWSDSWVLE